MSCVNYTKDVEKRILVEEYFEYLKWDEAMKMTDEELIDYFNKNKPRRRHCKNTGYFYGKYYTYDGEKLELKDSSDKIKEKVFNFLESNKGDEIILNMLTVLTDYVIKKLSEEYIPTIINFGDFSSYFTKKTEMSLPTTGKMWNKLIQYNFVDHRYKGKIYVPVEIFPAVKEAIEEWEKSKKFITEQIKKEEEIPDDLFDTIIDHTEDGEPIEDIINLKYLLKEAIKNHLKDPSVPNHILIVGDVATAKTMFLLEIARLKGTFPISGDMNIGKKGFIETILEIKPKIILIDEIQHLDAKTLAPLLSLAETGQIGEFTARRQEKITLQPMIIATTHPVDYNKLSNKTRGQGILDRFVRFDLDNYTDKQIRDLMKQVLVKRYNANEEIAEYIANKLVEKGVKSIRSAIRVYGLARNNKLAVDVAIKLIKPELHDKS